MTLMLDDFESVASLDDGFMYCNACHQVVSSVQHTAPTDRDCWCIGEGQYIKGPFYTESQLQQLIDQINAKDTELAAARAEIERLKALDTVSLAVTQMKAIAARDLVIKQKDAALSDINNWLVCSCIATAEDMAQSFPYMQELCDKALAIKPSQEALDKFIAEAVAEYKPDAERYRLLKTKFSYPKDSDWPSLYRMTYSFFAVRRGEKPGEPRLDIPMTLDEAIDVEIRARKDKP